MGFHAKKCATLTWFENVSQLKNIASIRSYLLEKNKTIGKKGWVQHNSLLIAQWLHEFTTFSNSSYLRPITLAYFNQSILHEFDGSSTYL